MADHLTEEEQLDAIKAWWKENWLLVIVPAVVIFIGYGSWSYYGYQKEQNALVGAEKYQELLDSIANTGTQPLSDEKVAKAKTLASGIIADHSGSMYADLANMIVARFEMDDKNYAAAEAALNEVVKSSDNDSVVSLAKARLAKVLLAKGDYDKALGYVASAEQSSFKAQYAEIRGDIYSAKGNAAAAKTAYEEAMSSFVDSQRDRRSIVELKLNGTSIRANTTEADDVDNASTEEVSSDAEETESVETADSGEGES